MGGKQARTRKHLYLCIAVLIFLSGCALIQETKRRSEANESVVRGKQLLAQGQYDGSLKEFQKVISDYGERSRADTALFYMALVYAHPENPKRNYRQALTLLQKLRADYPQSPWVEHAKVWAGVLMANEDLAQANEKLTESNERLTQAVEKLNQLIEKSRQIDLEIEGKRRGKEK